MMKKISQIIIPLLFISSVVTCLDIRVLSCSNNRGDVEMFLSNHPQEAFHHNHCEELEISHEEFFHPTDPSDLSEITSHSEKIHQDIITIPLKFARTFWHPPKLV